MFSIEGIQEFSLDNVLKFKCTSGDDYCRIKNKVDSSYRGELCGKCLWGVYYLRDGREMVNYLNERYINAKES